MVRSGGSIFSLLALLLLSIQAPSSFGSTQTIAGTNVLSLLGHPRYAPGCGDSPCFVVSYQDNLNMTVDGIALAVIHNALGQTVYYSAGGLRELRPAGNATFYIVVPDSSALFPLGTYNATFFVITPNWIAISGTSFLSYSITGY